MAEEEKVEVKPMMKGKGRLIGIGIVVLLLIIIIASGCSSGASNTSNQPQGSQPTVSSPVPATPAVPAQRQVTGKATDLGAGTFQGGQDVQAGLYDVTPVDGEGNFTVTSSGGDLIVNEILDGSKENGVAKVRVQISDGDQIQLQSINKTHFEPVTAPFVKTVQPLSLYAGTWTVGEDIAAGRYTASASSGSGNFVVNQNGTAVTNEILGGSMGVQNVTVNLENGETIDIGGLNQVNFVPVS